MKFKSLVLAVAILILASTPALAKIIHVPTDSSTIQGGINGAVNGDTVLVAPNTYYEHINFYGKAILLKSEKGADSTIISKAYDDLSIVTLESTEDTLTVIDGFTIQNAFGGEADGIRCTNESHPKIVNNVIKNNSNTVSKTLWTTSGGGISIFGGSGAVIRNNKFIANYTGNKGGGIYAEGAKLLIENNYFQYNFATDGGGAISISAGDSTIITGNLIINNGTSDDWGGVVYQEYSTNIEILNNTISGNTQTGYSTGTGVTIVQCTAITVKNNCITYNSNYGIYVSETDTVILEYNNVFGNSLGDYFGCVPGKGSISLDPMYCDTSAANYGIGAASPCRGGGEGGVDIGALGMACGVSVISGPDQSGQANSQVNISFYVSHFETMIDSFDLNITDSLGWTIVPTHYEVHLDSGEVDTADFVVSIPYVLVGTIDKLRLAAVSRSDPSLSGTGELTVTCTEYIEGLDISPGENISAPVFGLITAKFYVRNTGAAQDSFSLTVSDSLGWEILLSDSQLTLDPGQEDSVFCGIVIPDTPIGTTNKLVLGGVSLTNPFVGDWASLLITCDSYVINITGISDVGNDQGKQVSIEWTSFPSSDPLVTDFSVFRRKDSLLTFSADTSILSPSLSLAYPPGEWDWLVTLPAFGETLYSVVVPTLKDSTISEGMYWSVFFIRAGTDTPTVYFDSPIDSGYSLDNLSPSPPIGLLARHKPAVTQLTWEKCEDADFDYHTLYRDTTSEFEPSPDNRLGYVIDTIFIDSTAQLGKEYYYVVSATDFSGNESNPSNEAMGVRYIIGDANASGEIDIVDVVHIINYLFKSGPEPTPLESGDVNCDDQVTIADVVYLVRYLFKGFDPPCEPE